MNIAARKPLLATFALIAPLILAASTHAQAPQNAKPAQEESETIRMDVFNVTANDENSWAATNSLSGTRTAVPLIDTPRSVQVVTSEFLQDLAAPDVTTAADFFSGITAVGSQDQMNDNNTYQVRGFRQNKLYRDGVREPFASIYTDSATIDRVEILKGPSSLLAGVSDPGGEINELSKRPLAIRQMSLALGDDSHGMVRAVLDVSTPLNKSMNNRVVVARQAGDGWEPFAFVHKNVFYDAVEVKISRNLVYQATLEHISYVSNPATTLTVLNNIASNAALIAATPNQIGIVNGMSVGGVYFPWNFNPDGPYDRRTQNQTRFGNQLEFRISDMFSLRLFGSYLGMHRVDRRHQSSSTLYTTTVNGVVVPSTLSMSSTNDDDRTPTYTTQMDFVGKFKYFGISHQAILGAEYIDTDDVRIRDNTPTSGAGKPNDYNFLTGDTSGWAATMTSDRSVFSVPNNYTNSHARRRAVSFTNTFGMWGDRVHLLLGGRHDQGSIRVVNPIGTTPLAQYQMIYENWNSPSAGVIVKIAKELSAYTSYSESFAGVPVGQHDVTGAALNKQITGSGYDAGIKSSFLKDRVSLNAAFFVINQQNTNVQLTNSEITALGYNYLLTGASYVQNSSSRSRGFDCDILLTPFEGYQVFADFTHLKAYVTENFATPVLVGTPISQGPGNKWGSLFQKYSIPGGPFKGLAFTWGIVYRDGRRPYSVSTSTGAVIYCPAYTRHDIGVSYEFKAFGLKESAGIHVTNLFDKHYLEGFQNRGATRDTQFTLNTRF